ncbi:hypothetical protein JHK85_006194 [Glycine max]|nr:hypothetical protein JHK85_006194 [Glycine max]
MVVDQCDSTKGCDADQDYQPPCANNIVDASNAVWEALHFKFQPPSGRLRGKKPPSGKCN